MKPGGFQPRADEFGLGEIEVGGNGGGFHLPVSGFTSAKTRTPAPVWTVLCTCASTCLADMRLAVVDDDHGAVGQIADALAFVAAFADNFELHGFAGNQRGLHQVADFVQVDANDALQAGDLGEVGIVGEQLGVEVAREPDELGVHAFFLGEIAVVDADFDFGVVLQAG